MLGRSAMCSGRPDRRAAELEMVDVECAALGRRRGGLGERLGGEGASVPAHVSAARPIRQARAGWSTRRLEVSSDLGTAVWVGASVET